MDHSHEQIQLVTGLNFFGRIASTYGVCVFDLDFDLDTVATPGYNRGFHITCTEWHLNCGPRLRGRVSSGTAASSHLHRLLLTMV